VSVAKINETSTFGPADDDITFDYDGDDYGDDNDEEDIVDAVSKCYSIFMSDKTFRKPSNLLKLFLLL